MRRFIAHSEHFLHAPNLQAALEIISTAAEKSDAVPAIIMRDNSAGCGGFHIDGLSPRVRTLRSKLLRFMEEHVLPSEAAFEEHASGPMRWTIPPLMEQLKDKAKRAGLWNLWLPASLAALLEPLVSGLGEAERVSLLGPGLNNLEYAHLCEITGRSPWAPEVFNCGAPDTGNMEVRHETHFQPSSAQAGEIQHSC